MYIPQTTTCRFQNENDAVGFLNRISQYKTEEGSITIIEQRFMIENSNIVFFIEIQPEWTKEADVLNELLIEFNGSKQ